MFWHATPGSGSSRHLEDPCLIGAGGREDCEFLETQTGIIAVPLAHGDYLEEDGHHPPYSKENL